MNPEPLFLFLIFLAVCTGAYLAGNILVSVRNRRMIYEHSLPEEDRAALQGPLGQIKPLLQDIVMQLKQKPSLAEIVKQQGQKYITILTRSGNPGMLTGEEVFAIKLILPFVLFGVVLFAVGSSYFFIALAVGLLGFYLPDMKLNELAEKRQQAIKEGLPDALDSFALMMRAGLDLNQSVDYFIDDAVRDPLQQEFYYMRTQMRLGKTRSQAIQSMAQRLQLEEFDTIATTVVQAESSGVSMTDFFQNQAEEVRDRRFQAAEEQGQKAPFKMMIPLMLFIMPGVGLILFAPMVIKYVTGQF